MTWLFLTIILVSATAIAYQDFTKRLISIWWILCFGIACISYFLLAHTLTELIENIIFCVVYLLLSYLILHLFYFIKTKKFQKILDSKIGWGDILLLLLTGSCLHALSMIYFFTITFVVTLIFQLVFQRQKKDIALGAMLVICYSVYLIALLVQLF
jgi:hypothetical protein